MTRWAEVAESLPTVGVLLMVVAMVAYVLAGVAGLPSGDTFAVFNAGFGVWALGKVVRFLRRGTFAGGCEEGTP